MLHEAWGQGCVLSRIGFNDARLLVCLSVCDLDGEGEHDSIYVELAKAYDEMLS